jgi:hypothetical protein
VETAYLNINATKGDDEWLEKQRILLADMALHLLQTALNPSELEHDKLKNNLYSILTISDQFLPNIGLKMQRINCISKTYKSLSNYYLRR